MSRQDANAAFALSSFLYGGNAAYIEDLYARYEADPNSVDAEWRDFFGSLKDNAADVAKSARGASWKKPQVIARDDTLSALDGQWAETEKKIGDKVRAKAQAPASNPFFFFFSPLTLFPLTHFLPVFLLFPRKRRCLVAPPMCSRRRATRCAR